jgi:hypothetical protein
MEHNIIPYHLLGSLNEWRIPKFTGKRKSVHYKN